MLGVQTRKTTVYMEKVCVTASLIILSMVTQICHGLGGLDSSISYFSVLRFYVARRSEMEERRQRVFMLCGLVFCHEGLTGHDS